MYMFVICAVVPKSLLCSDIYLVQKYTTSHVVHNITLGHFLLEDSLDNTQASMTILDLEIANSS